MKTRLTAFAERVDTPFEKVQQYARIMLRNGELTGKGRNTWVTPEGIEVLEEKFILPEIVPDVFEVYAQRLGANKKWVRCLNRRKHEGVPHTFYALAGKDAQSCIGKNIKVERIQDEKGETFRYLRPKLFHGVRW